MSNILQMLDDGYHGIAPTAAEKGISWLIKFATYNDSRIDFLQKQSTISADSLKNTFTQCIFADGKVFLSSQKPILMAEFAKMIFKSIIPKIISTPWFVLLEDVYTAEIKSK
jgi:hypothetical protein